MNQNIATFEKVSFEEYYDQKIKFYDQNILNESEEYKKKVDDDIFNEWKNIKIPFRSTAGAAGYDFYTPFKFTMSGEDASYLIPTGIRCKIEPGWVLMLYPRSGLGTKYGVGLDNTTGIIDSDYYYATNQGHIMAKIHSKKYLALNPGDRFIQGVFLPFGTASNGNSDEVRTGGFGSTGK